MRIFALTVAFACLAAPAAVRADPFHLKDDPRFSAGARGGVFHLSDRRFDVTWIQPLSLDVSWSPFVSNRLWFPRLRLYAYGLADNADLSYHETPAAATGEGDLSGIHRARVHKPVSLTGGGGAQLSIFENRWLHIDVFAEAATMVRPAAVEAEELTVEVNGLQIDVARAVREYAELTFDWRTARAGMTVGGIFRPWGIRTMPYLTLGVFNYRATFAFRDLDPKLESALIGFGIDPEVIHARSVSRTKFIATTGLRVDLNRRWSLETNALAGRVDGAWFYSVQGGLTVRWNP